LSIVASKVDETNTRTTLGFMVVEGKGGQECD
jgi:hypothetical protein